MRKIVSLIAILVLSATVQQAAAQLAGRCQGLDPARDGDADRAFECIAALENKLDEVMALYARAEQSHRPEIPSGAVLAFDSSGGCPAGWSPFKPSQGRVLIGATFGTGYEPGLANNENGDPLVEYKYREHGGIEIVTLSEAQMPEHRHRIPYVSWDMETKFKDAGLGRSVAYFDHGPDLALDGARVAYSMVDTGVRPTGGDQPHNNMPPYIALYFCKKD